MLSPLRLLSLAFAAFLSFGCASGPTFSEIESRLPPIPEDQGRIFVYRPSMLGAAVQPAIMLNEESVGTSKAHGFFYVDRPAGEYRATASTEVERSASFTLEAQQTRYVLSSMVMGFWVGHVNLSVIGEEEGLEGLQSMHFTGDESLLTPEIESQPAPEME